MVREKHLIGGQIMKFASRWIILSALSLPFHSSLPVSLIQEARKSKDERVENTTETVNKEQESLSGAGVALRKYIWTPGGLHL